MRGPLGHRCLDQSRSQHITTDVAIGVISLSRSIVKPFTDKQIELVSTFADQAVIAIENARLFEAEQQRTRELTESLEQQTRDLSLDHRVRFAGHTVDISGLLARSTFLAHTSDNEGCPNVIMEAMACGRAVVATDAGDIPSLVDDGKTGFVVPRGDDTALVDRLEKLIVERDLCKRMGEAGRAKAEREFGVDRLVSDTLAVYRAAGWKDAQAVVAEPFVLYHR